MRLLLDARLTRRMSAGMRSYVRELAMRLPEAAPDIELATIVSGENFSLAEQLAIPLAARRADLVHFPTIFAPAILPRRYVLTLHDAIHLRFPALFSPATAAYYRLFVRRLARRAARVIVGDPRTVADCERYFGLRPERVRVVPLGYDPALLDVPAPPADRPYLLYAGNHRPHKNLATLIDAWRSLPSGCTVDLCLTGGDDLGASGLAGPGRLILLGDLSPYELAGRIRGAAAVVQPSLLEGYGLPVLEAMVRGTPAIVSETGGPAALAPYASTFPARDTAVLRSLIDEAVRAPDRMRRRAAEGEAVARAYTWHRFATSTAAVYREALEGPLHS